MTTMDSSSRHQSVNEKSASVTRIHLNVHSREGKLAMLVPLTAALPIFSVSLIALRR